MANNPPRCVFCFIDPEAYELKQCDKRKNPLLKLEVKRLLRAWTRGDLEEDSLNLEAAIKALVLLGSR